MEPQNDLPQQEKQGFAPTKKSNHSLLVIATVFVTAALVGGGVFLFQQNSNKKVVSDLEDKLVQMQSDNTDLKSKLDDLEKAVAEAKVLEEETAENACKGVWKDDACVNLTCIDSDVNEKPDDIYIKGTVTYTDELGTETIVNDECTGSKTQVNEMWCYESPTGSGNYVQGKMVYNCGNGCLDGACIK